MRVTSVRLGLLGAPPLLASASVVFDDDFIVHNVKLVNVAGKILLAMPNRKATRICRGCGGKNDWDAMFCNGCGAGLPPAEPAKRNFDVAHPISKRMRQEIEDAVLAEYSKVVSQGEYRRDKAPTAGHP